MAKNFNEWQSDWGAPQAVLFEIHTSSGPVISAHSEKPYEFEVLFPAGLELKTLARCEYRVADQTVEPATGLTEGTAPGVKALCDAFGSKSGFAWARTTPAALRDLTFLERLRVHVRRAQNGGLLSHKPFPPAKIVIIIQCVVGEDSCTPAVADEDQSTERELPGIHMLAHHGDKPTKERKKKHREKEYSRRTSFGESKKEKE